MQIFFLYKGYVNHQELSVCLRIIDISQKRAFKCNVRRYYDIFLIVGQIQFWDSYYLFDKKVCGFKTIMKNLTLLSYCNFLLLFFTFVNAQKYISGKHH